MTSKQTHDCPPAAAQEWPLEAMLDEHLDPARKFRAQRIVPAVAGRRGERLDTCLLQISKTKRTASCTKRKCITRIRYEGRDAE
jgi:hypothetical protein